jgi:hypothetical protein
MTWTPWSEWRVRVAAGFTVVAVVAAIVSTVGVVRTDAVAPADPFTAAADGDAQLARRIAPAHSLTELDPFGTADAVATAMPSAAPTAPPDIVLVGTVLGADDPAAICRLGDARPRILHAGDTLGGWRLLQVTPGKAVFIDAAAVRHELRLSPLGN